MNTLSQWRDQANILSGLSNNFKRLIIPISSLIWKSELLTIADQKLKLKQKKMKKTLKFKHHKCHRKKNWKTSANHIEKDMADQKLFWNSSDIQLRAFQLQQI